MLKSAKAKLSRNIYLSEMLKGSSQSFILKALGLLAGYFFIWLAARKLGPKAVGIYSLMVAFTNVIIVVGRMGFHKSLVKIVAESRAIGKKIYPVIVAQKFSKTVIVFNAFLTLIIWLGAPYIAKSFNNNESLIPYIRLSSLMFIPIALAQVANAYIRGLKMAWQFSFIQDFIRIVISLIALYLFITFMPSSNDGYPFYSWLIAWFMVFLLSYFIFFRALRPAKIKLINTGFIDLKPLLYLSLPLMLTDSMSFLLRFTDTLVLGFFSESGDIGIYNTASRLATFTSLLLVASTTIAAPQFAELYGVKKYKQLARVVQQFTLITLILSLPATLVFILFPDFILSFFGKDFTNGNLSLIILSISQLVNIATGLGGVLLNMTGRQVYMQNLFIFITILNVLLNFALIPFFGIVGAAIATGISLVVKNMMVFFYIKRIYGFFPLSFKPIFNLLK